MLRKGSLHMPEMQPFNELLILLHTYQIFRQLWKNDRRKPLIVNDICCRIRDAGYLI